LTDFCFLFVGADNEKLMKELIESQQSKVRLVDLLRHWNLHDSAALSCCICCCLSQAMKFCSIFCMYAQVGPGKARVKREKAPAPPKTKGFGVPVGKK